MFKKIYFIGFVFISLIVYSSTAVAVQEAHNVTITLKFNGVSPNMGNNYIITPSNQNTISGIIIKDNANNFQKTSNTISSNYNIETRAYLTYTKGNTDDIKQRIIIILGNNYNNLYNPSFAFPIAKKNTLELGLKYDSINIENTEVLKSGFKNIVIKNIGFMNNKNSISITEE